MKKKPSYVLLNLLVALCGCGSLSPMNNLYRESFSRSIHLDTREAVMNTNIKAKLPSSFADVWNAALTVLTQYAVIPIVKQYNSTSGSIVYIDIDALPKKKKFLWADLPFSLYIQEMRPGVTDVFVKPKTELLTSKYSKKDMSIIEKAMQQKGNEFLLALINQIPGEDRWKQLRNEYGG